MHENAKNVFRKIMLDEDDGCMMIVMQPTIEVGKFYIYIMMQPKIISLSQVFEIARYGLYVSHQVSS